MENQPNNLAYWGKHNEVVWMRVAVGLEGIMVEEVPPVDVAGLEQVFHSPYLPPQLPAEQRHQRAKAVRGRQTTSFICYHGNIIVKS